MSSRRSRSGRISRGSAASAASSRSSNASRVSSEFIVTSQSLAQQSARAMQLSLYGTRRAADHLRDFLMLVAFDIVQHERLAGAGWQRRNRTFQVHTVVGIITAAPGPLENPRILHTLDAADATTRRAAVLEHDIDRDPVQPGRELTVSAKRAQLLPDAHEDILR